MTTNINDTNLEVGDVINTKTLKDIYVISPTEILFIKDGNVIIEHINMLKQHQIVAVINPSERK